MALTTEEKNAIIKEFQTHEGDTGSSQVQIAILTHEIKRITEHLKQHPKDYHTRRGLIKKVYRRRHLLDYLSKKDIAAYRDIIKKLGIRR